MTPEMAFEGLLVSRDPAFFRPLDRILRDFSISTSVCPTPALLPKSLAEGSADLIVIDWEGTPSTKLLGGILKSRTRQKPTILAVTSEDLTIPCVHAILRKPVTDESGRQSVKTAYLRMLRDYRRHARYPLMISAEATGETRRLLSIAVANVGDGGLGLITKEKLTVGEILSIRLALPETKKEIHIQARVQWTRAYGAAGCEFRHIPAVDLQILYDWLESKCRIKKPLG